MSDVEALRGDRQPSFETPDAQGLEVQGRSQWQIAWRRFLQHRLALLGLFVLVVFYLAAIFAPAIAPYDPNFQDLSALREAPSAEHWMGTDAVGRDYFSRILFGGRVSLAVGVGVAFSAGLFGTLVGAIAGYYGGWIENLLMRVTDLFLSFPFLAIAILASSVLSGRIIDIVIILAAIFWMPVARIVRGLFLAIKEREYVEAARASGAGATRIILRHMLPNALGPIIVNLTLGIAFAILAESALSFLGFGIQPPTATWGNMLAGNQSSMLSQPWLVWFPGLMILATVLAVNFLGDGLRDALDPTSQRVRA